MSNMGLFKAMKRDGIEVCVTTVGDKYVNEAMVPTDMCSAESSPDISFSVSMRRSEMESLRH